jgi:hypothetical protein
MVLKQWLLQDLTQLLADLAVVTESVPLCTLCCVSLIPATHVISELLQ